MSAIRSLLFLPPILISRKTRPILLRWKSKNCRVLLDVQAKPAEFRRPEQRSGADPPGLWRRRCRVPRCRSYRRTRAYRRPAFRPYRWKPAAPSAATMPRAAFSNCMRRQSGRTAFRNCSRACSGIAPSGIHIHESACRRRLRRPRRALSRGRAGLRCRQEIQPPGEMDRRPARAFDRGQSLAQQVHKIRAAVDTDGVILGIDDVYFTTRALMCAPMRRASCT